MAERFGNYELLEPLASGGMARVYRARMIGALGFEKIVALKFMLPGFAADPEAVKMFIDEARLAATLSHANIVGILDFGQKDGEYYIAMEYVSGANLRVILRRAIETKRLPSPTMAARIAAEVALGLDYAHKKTDAQGNPLWIVHRDVSPQNVVVSWTGEVKILDFGIARSAQRSTQTSAGTIKGKYSYMSPEQARAGTIDGRSDVFSLGAVFYELLTGVRAFPNPGLETLERVKRAQFTPILEVKPDVPPRLAEAVTRAMALDPDERYRSAGELVEVLALWLAEARVRGERGGDAASLAAWVESLFRATEAESSAPKSGEPSVLSGWEDLAGRRDEALPPPRADLTFSASDEPVDLESTSLSATPAPVGASPFAAEEAHAAKDAVPTRESVAAVTVETAPLRKPQPSRPNFAAVAAEIGKPLPPRGTPKPEPSAEPLWNRTPDHRGNALAIGIAGFVVFAGILGLAWHFRPAATPPAPTPAPIATPLAVATAPTPVPTASAVSSTVAAAEPSAAPTIIQPLTIDKSAKPIGLLEIASTPAGAQVSINGRVLGESPVLVPNLLVPGSYLVEVLKEGYAPWSREVDLSDDNAVDLVANLAVPEVPGRIALPLPNAVRCFVDGHLAGTGPRRVAVDVQPGNHQVRLRDPEGTLLRAYEVLVSSGHTSELDVPPSL